jgi:hypothetical protein
LGKFSVSLIAVGEFGLGVLLAVWGLYFVSAFFASLSRGHAGEVGLSAIATVFLFGFSFLCFRLGLGLIKKSRRAWLASLWLGILIALIGLLCFWSAAHPTDDYSRSEAGFGFGLAGIVLLISIVWLVLLTLPQTRGYVFCQDTVAESSVIRSEPSQLE